MEFKELQQSLNLNSNGGINNYIDNLLVKKCETVLNLKEISFAYKIKLFLSLMSISITFDRILSDYKDGKRFELDLNLNNFIDAFSIEEKTVEIDQCAVVLYPLSNAFNNNDENMLDFIKSINIHKIDIDFFNLSENDKIEIFYNLPANIIAKIKNEIGLYIKDASKDIFSVTTESGEVFKCSNSLNKGYIIDIIKFLFKEDLMLMYKNIYNITKKLGFKYSDFYHITQSEIQIFINLYNEEVEKNSNKTTDKGGIDLSEFENLELSY
jgi:hypothetical protein